MGGSAPRLVRLTFGKACFTIGLPRTKGSHPMFTLHPHHDGQHTSDAQVAASALLAQYGAPQSEDALRNMLALAYAVGAKTAATDAAEAVKSA